MLRIADLMSPQRPSRQPSVDSPELIDPRWILKALLVTIAFALVCVYVLFCVIFYMQQWQLALHPSRTVSRDPSALSLPFQEVHFSPDAAGEPQLDGWWIPADTTSDPTALVLHGGEGSISDALPLARTLHDARMNVLLFDYRGFGRSAGQHPSEKMMEADSDAALAWLLNAPGGSTAGSGSAPNGVKMPEQYFEQLQQLRRANMRHIAPAQTIIVGDRLGASLAVRLCTQHSDLAGLILQQGDGDFASRAAADRRARMVPFRLLFHEDFPLVDPLHTLKTPKLLISYTGLASPVDVQRAAAPKITVEIPNAADESAVHGALRRFLDTYLAQPPQQLVPVL
jgi:pimeloyl-ACP methyl ester carboxylesterase